MRTAGRGLNRPEFCGGSRLWEDGAMEEHRQYRGKYPDEMRERAVRMVLDHEGEYASQWEAICSVAEKLGPTAETVRLWVRRAETDRGVRSGPTSDQIAELKRIKRENAELRRTNDILQAAASFFGAELDRQQKR
jgi:transposase